MPTYILNATNYNYLTMEQYLAELQVPSETADTYYLLFAFPIEALFEKIKRRAALRAKVARDQQGNSQLDSFILTEDERDIYLDYLQSGAGEIFKQVSGFSKNIASAFRFNVSFGTPVVDSTVVSVSGDGLTITDSALTMTVNAYAGMKLVITSAGLLENQERTIVSNTATAFVVSSAFSGDVTSLEYVVSIQTEKFILIYSAMNVLGFDTNMILGMDALFEKCFIGTVLRDWYLINRFMPDYEIEKVLLKDAISDLRMHYFQTLKQERATEFFNSDDSSSVTTP